MNLIVDIGNTRTKLASFEGNTIENIQNIDSETINLSQIINTKTKDFRIISSVKSINVSQRSTPSLIFFNQNTSLPIKNNYKSSSIGMDRLAAAVGAQVIFPHQDCLIIDMGSAITVDFLSKDSIFVGGNISLGMALRFKALHNFTDHLPLVNQYGETVLTSTTTVSAIRSGVINSIKYELDGYINDYQKKYSGLKIILTGGDANFFAKQLKKRIFADENLVLKGLNRILNYNVNKK